MHARRIESLREQVAMHAPHGGGFLQRLVAKASAECLRDQIVFVQVSKDFSDGLASQVAVDAECFDLTQRPSSPVMLQVGFGARAGQCGAAVVKRALADQAPDGLVDVVRTKLTTLQTCAYLRFAQFLRASMRRPVRYAPATYRLALGRGDRVAEAV